MTAIDRLERLEKAVGVLIGASLGGVPGARLGASAIQLHQVSPIHELEAMMVNDMENRIRQQLARSPTADWLMDSSGPGPRSIAPPKKKKRKASAYNKRYSKCFKKLAPKYKKKNGGWKKDGFARCSKAARKCAK